MAEITFRPPHATDIIRVGSRLRLADEVEILAAGLMPPKAVVDSVRTSSLVRAIVVDGEPVALCGVAPRADHGQPWLLGTDGVRRHARTLMREAPAYIAAMLRAHPVLINFVHAENTESVAWLRHMKFVVLPAAPYGAHGAMFHRFEMRA